MNPLRELWKQAAAHAENLIEGLFDRGTEFVGPEEFSDETQVHGFFRRVSSTGEEMGFGFYCPMRGSADHEKPLSSGDYIKHCGRTEVLDTEAFLPTVRMRPRGRWQISTDGTQAIPTDAMEEFGGDFKYEPGDPGF